jgi:primosomal protein N' (replication factor Y)
MTIARVALDVPLPRLFDYSFDPTWNVEPGARVLVPFGPRRRVGVVVALARETDIPSDKIRAALGLLADTAPLSREWLALAEFCSQYYQRPLGEVIQSALPPRLKRAEPLRAAPSAWTLTAAGRDALAAATAARPSLKRTLLWHLAYADACPHEILMTLGTRAAAALRALHGEGLIASATALPTTHRFVDERTLSAAQTSALAAITASLDRFAAFVLFGVTGSGKTEVYLHAIDRTLAAGKQALVLVPEINLTPQLAAEFGARFPGVPIGVLHSNLAANERARTWIDAQSGNLRIILGTRMAVFAPLARLGLIVVDEEHDASFKQQDGVRYSARDLAVVRAQRLAIPVVLGSATPALETYANAQAGRYRLLSLPERVRAGAALPRVELVDMRKEIEMHGISARLAEAVRERIARQEQSLLFLNRRGYAPVLACGACGWVSDCSRCAAHLVVHYAPARAPRGARHGLLRCHHCGLEAPAPRHCPSCGNVDLVPFGRGTQRLEDAVQSLFPEARVLRIDSDTTRARGSWDRMRADIDAGAVDVLIGTQILAKGHDFPRLTLVGVLNADAALMAADYRAPERLFAQLQQVAGRAGRADLRGEVLVQTRYPEAALYQSLVRHDYEGFAARQLQERTEAGFPPAAAEAVVRAEARTPQAALALLRQALQLAPADHAEVTLFDPVPMSLSRLSGWERAHVLVQSPSRRALQAFLSVWIARLYDMRVAADARWHVDVDPLEF